MLRRISAGEAPDVAHIASHWTSFFAYMGAFEKLENLLSADNLEERWHDKDLWGGLYRNRLYSVAWGLCPIALIVNTQLVAEAGAAPIADPLSLDNFAHMCAQIEQHSSRPNVYSYGFNLAGDETDFLRIYPFLQAFEGGLAETQGTVQFNSPRNAAAFAWLKHFMRERRVLLADMPAIRQRFAQGDVACISDGPWIAPVLEELTGKPFDAQFEVHLNPVQSGAVSSSWMDNHALAICSQSAHKLHAAALVDALTNDADISRQYYASVGHLPVHRPTLEAPGTLSTCQQAYARQLTNSRCLNAQNRMFEKALDFCADAMRNILFEGADIG